MISIVVASQMTRRIRNSSCDEGWVFMIYLPNRATARYKKNAWPPRLLSKRPRTDGMLIQSGLQGGSGGIALRGARCVTVMLVGWNVSSCQRNMVHDGATLRLKTQRINTLIGGRKEEDKESGHGHGTGGDQPSPASTTGRADRRDTVTSLVG
jgi:hypothetical protein